MDSCFRRDVFLLRFAQFHIPALTFIFNYFNFYWKSVLTKFFENNLVDALQKFCKPVISFIGKKDWVKNYFLIIMELYKNQTDFFSKPRYIIAHQRELHSNTYYAIQQA